MLKTYANKHFTTQYTNKREGLVEPHQTLFMQMFRGSFRQGNMYKNGVVVIPTYKHKSRRREEKRKKSEA